MKKGRFRFLILSLAMIQFFIFFSANSLFSQTNKVRVIKKDAELKLKPNNESLTIINLPLGGEFDVEETIGEWVKVKLPPDKDGIILTGYINSSFLEFRLVSNPLPNIPKADRESPVSSQGDDYLRWQEKMNSAKSRKSLWTAVSYSGAVIFLVSGAITLIDIAAASKEEDKDAGDYAWKITYKETGVPVPTIVIIGDVFGLVTLIAGAAGQHAAYDYEMQLKSEGESKGYLRAGFLPKYRAMGIQLGISF
jgi:hypothetical protein